MAIYLSGATAARPANATRLPPNQVENQVEIKLIHELGRYEKSYNNERVEVIAPSRVPTRVHVKWEFVGDTNKSLSSPVYMATLRRRKAKSIARMVSELAGYSERTDFTAFTFPIIDQLKSFLSDLENAEREGNTREILRQLRNSFLDGGWENYREPRARQSAIVVLSQLAEAESVSPENVKDAFKQFIRNNLNPVGLHIPDLETAEEEQEDASQETEIPG